MSTDAVRQFLDRVSEDAELEDALFAEIRDKGDQTDAIVAFAVGRGHDFTVVELAEVLDELQDTEELTAEQLDAVAGGLSPQPEPPDRRRIGRSIRMRVPGLKTRP